VDYAVLGSHHVDGVACAGTDQGMYRLGKLVRRSLSLGQRLLGSGVDVVVLPYIAHR